MAQKPADLYGKWKLRAIEQRQADGSSTDFIQLPSSPEFYIQFTWM